jgi:ECF transporter S component (folate family)
MTQTKTLNLVRAAMFAALTCIATYVIKIPTPGTGGYIHFGDAFALLSGIVLGPLYGAAAAGIGSALSDIVGGYVFYAPVTLLIKGLAAFAVGFLYRSLAGRIKSDRARSFLGSLTILFIVPLGYFVYEMIIYGPAAAASIPANIIQAASGVIIAFILYPLIKNFINR